MRELKEESLSLCSCSLHLKKKFEGVKRSLDWEKIGKVKEYQEERVKTKEGKVDISQLKINVRSIDPALGDCAVT